MRTVRGGLAVSARGVLRFLRFLNAVDLGDRLLEDRLVDAARYVGGQDKEKISLLAARAAGETSAATAAAAAEAGPVGRSAAPPHGARFATPCGDQDRRPTQCAGGGVAAGVDVAGPSPMITSQASPSLA